MHIAESHSLAGNAINVRSRNLRLAVVTAGIANPQIVGKDDNDVRSGRRISATCRNSGKWNENDGERQNSRDRDLVQRTLSTTLSERANLIISHIRASFKMAFTGAVKEFDPKIIGCQLGTRGDAD